MFGRTKGREGRGRLKGRGWAPQDLIEHCNDRASDDRGRNAYSQATYFKSSAIKCADKSKHNSTAQIGGACRGKEGGDRRGKIILFKSFFISHRGKFSFPTVSTMKPLNKLFSPQTYITLILYRSAKEIQQLKCVLSSVFILFLIVMWAAESTDNQYPLFCHSA